MTTNISHYLNTLRDSLRLDSTAESDVMREIEAHIEDEVEDLKESGLSEDEATNKCLGLMGSAKTLARQIYEARSQGSWKQALMASTPHVVFALFFFLDMWQAIGWLVVAVGLIAAGTVYGWWHGKPSWLLTWVGYFFLPVVPVGLAILYLPPKWIWVVFPVYASLCLWLLYRVFSKNFKNDWLYVSVMLLPIPVVVSWFLAVNYQGEYTAYTAERLGYFAPWIGLSFMVLALAVASFVRIRNRKLKIAALSVTGLTTVSLVALHTWRVMRLFDFIALLVLMIGILVIPGLLRSRPQNFHLAASLTHRNDTPRE